MRGQLSCGIENRLQQAVHTLNGTEQYVYNPSNQRVWKKDTSQNETVYIYGPDGQRLASMSASWGNGIHFSNTALELRLGGRLITSVASGDSAGSLVEDRLGSGWASQYFPYGETRSGGAGFQFATYRRDSATQFDYAQNRYYSSKVARFLTPDPWGASAGPGEPQSFNRYAYVRGDPINHFDSTGLGPEDLGKDDQYQDKPYIDYTVTGTLAPCVSTFCVPPDASSAVNPQHSCMVAVMQAFFANPISVGYGSLRAFEVCFGLPTSVPSQGGPGGAGPVTTLAQVPAALSQAIKGLGSNCKEVLPNQQTLLEDAKDLKFFDAGGTVSGSRTIAQIAPALAPYNPSGTIQSIVGADNARILWGPPLQGTPTISNTVLLGAQFWLDPVQGNNANSSFGQGTVLVHELLHYATQLTDDQFVQTYYIQLQQNESSSSGISRWLQNNCMN